MEGSSCSTSTRVEDVQVVASTRRRCCEGVGSIWCMLEELPRSVAASTVMVAAASAPRP